MTWWTSLFTIQEKNFGDEYVTIRNGDLIVAKVGSLIEAEHIVKCLTTNASLTKKLKEANEKIVALEKEIADKKEEEWHMGVERDLQS